MKKEISVPPTSLNQPRRQAVRKWVLRLSLALTILGPLIFILAALGAKLGIWSWMFGLGTLTRDIGPKVLMAGLAVSFLALVLGFFVKPRKGIIIAVVGILIPLFCFGRLVSVQKTVANLPFIHDVTTDTQNPPLFSDALLVQRAKVGGVNTADYIGKKAPTSKKDADGKPVMKLVSALQTQAYPQIRPLVLSDDPQVVFGRAEQIVQDMGWAVVTSDVTSGIIEATDTTFWYGFQDDVIIRLRPSEGGGTIVDMRSLSRVGGSDIGKNAARIEAFLKALNEG